MIELDPTLPIPRLCLRGDLKKKKKKNGWFASVSFIHEWTVVSPCE